MEEMLKEILAIVKEIKAATVRDPKAIIRTPFGDIDPNAPPRPEIPVPPAPEEPVVIPPPYSREAVTIKQFIEEGRPLSKSWEGWMKTNPEYFTDTDLANYLPWKGAVGGDVQWLQLGIGWYKADGSTEIPPGMFSPYGFEYTSDLYAAYKKYRAAGGKEQDA